MINVCTVHWREPKWIPVQFSYLERNLNAPFRIFAALNGIDDAELWKPFHFAEDLPGTHYEKLNALAQIAMEQSDPSDLLVFLDSDAFPIRPLEPWLTTSVARHKLVAVRRDENAGDREPHASFCAAQGAFWHEIDGDWDNYGRILRRRLEERSIDWLPMLRTNTTNLHPVWFAVYAHRVYHHGAGSRSRVSRADEARDPDLRSGRVNASTNLVVLTRKLRSDPRSLLRVRPRDALKLARVTKNSVAVMRRARFARQATGQSDAVFSRLAADPTFYREFDDTDG